MRWKRLIQYIWMALMLPVFANIPLLCMLYLHEYGQYGGIGSYAVLVVILCGVFISWLYLNILPFQKKDSPGVRLNAMRGGTVLVVCSLYGFVLQGAIFAVFYSRLWLGRYRYHPERHVLIGSAVYAAAICFLLLWNGILRMFLLSVRLRVRTRVLMLLAMWIPGVNLLVLLYARRLVLAEYDFACYKEAVRTVRAESDLCRTKYPLIMVHGIGFRDLKYFNYWGRIPRELVRYGATVYYGNQEAMGTIADNGEDIRDKVRSVMAETGCEKVNIIAHSKGGLDSRYAISKLGIADCVASLTTVNTPHHGCRFVDHACHLPDWLYRFVAKLFDGAFRRFGDRRPDFYTATRQFSTITSRQFNQDIPDAAGVYYQSYTSVMKDALSDPLLWLPYLIIYPLEGANDGLVSVDSARWGEFQAVFNSRKHRGISHGDVIDLKREDYEGFDVVECFVQIVSELKSKGF
ncbi:MAG: lipase family alpha/beta hydrolase [Lachnospiraceae bacterium]